MSANKGTVIGLWFRLLIFTLALTMLFFEPVSSQAQNNSAAICNPPNKLIDSLEKSIANGSLAEARAMAAAINSQNCPQAASRLARVKTRLAIQIQNTRNAVSKAVLSCDIDAVWAAHEKAVALGFTSTPQEQQQITKLSAALERVTSILKLAQTSYQSGDFAAVSDSLNKVRSHLGAIRAQSRCVKFYGAIKTISSNSNSTQALLARSRQIAQSCSLDAIRKHKAEMVAAPNRIAVITSRLAQLDKTITSLNRATLARRLAKSHMSKGIFNEAEKLFRKTDDILATTPGSAGCKSVRSALAGEIASASQHAKVLKLANNSLASCQLPALRKTKSALAHIRNEKMASLSANVETAITLALRMSVVQRHISAGRFEAASKSLDHLIAGSKDKPTQVCNKIITSARTLRAGIIDTHSRLARLDAAAVNCDIPTIDTALKNELSRDTIVVNRVSKTRALVKEIKRANLFVTDTSNILNQHISTKTLSKLVLDTKPLTFDLGGKNNCKQLQSSIQQVKTSASGLLTEMLAFETFLLTSCSLVKVSTIEKRKSFFSAYPGLAALKAHVTALDETGKILRPNLERHIEEKNYGQAADILNTAIGKLKNFPKEYCHSKPNGLSLVQNLIAGRDKFVQLKSIFAKIPDQRQSCNVPQISQTLRALQKLNLSGNFRINLKEEIRQTRLLHSDCVEKQRAADRATTLRSCISRLGDRAIVVERGNQFGCECQNPYIRNPARTACVKPRYLVENEAHQSCQQQYGQVSFAIEIKDNGEHQCKCGKEYTFISGEKKCVNPTKKQLYKITKLNCQKSFGQLSIPTNIKSIDDYQCTCAKSAKWNAGKSQCNKRPRRKELVKKKKPKTASRPKKRSVGTSGWKNRARRTSKSRRRAIATRYCRGRYGSSLQAVRIRRTKFYCRHDDGTKRVSFKGFL